MRLWIVALVLLVAAAGGYWWLGGSPLAALTATPSATPAVAGPVPVQVQPVRAAPIRSLVTYSGAIQPSSQVNVSPRAVGQIQSVRVEVGATVRAGDPLAQLDPGTLAAQVQQAQAALSSAQARLDLLLAGAKPVDVSAAQAALDAAQTRLAQLISPSASDISAADAAVAAATATAGNTDAAVVNAKATLLGNIFTLCTSWGGFGIPCGTFTIPLPSDVTDAVASSLTTFIGSIGSTPAPNAVAVLQSNSNYIIALNNATSAKQALLAAQAKRDLLKNPTPADIAAQRSLAEAARSTLQTRQTPYTDADIEAARSTVAQTQAQLALARANLDQTTIVAPFDGVVAQKLLDVGATVTAQTPIFVLITKALESHLTVDEARVGQLRPGMDAELTVPAFPGKTFRAKIAPQGDARAHTFDVKVLMDDPDGQLRPGMFAQLAIILAQRSDAIQVPTSAIVAQGQTSRVFVVVDGKAVGRAVRLGVSDGTNTEVLEGLAAGDSIVVFGQNTLRDGQAVLVATPAPGAGGPGGGAPRPQGSGTPGAGTPGGGGPGGGGPPRTQPSSTPTP